MTKKRENRIQCTRNLPSEHFACDFFPLSNCFCFDSMGSGEFIGCAIRSLDVLDFLPKELLFFSMRSSFDLVATRYSAVVIVVFLLT